MLKCELSLLSPPVGMTLYVIQTVRREGNIGTVFAGTIPFVAAMILMTAIRFISRTGAVDPAPPVRLALSIYFD